LGNLYCAILPKGAHDVRLIQINRDLQEDLSAHFGFMEERFYEGIDDYIAFDGAYTPDPNQLMQMPLTDEMASIVGQMDAGAIGRDQYNPEELGPEQIRALFWHYQHDGYQRVIVQNFTRAQAVSRRGKLISWSDGDTFKRLEEPSILIGDKIDGVIWAGRFQFSNFNAAKQIFDLSAVYREATDAEVGEFVSLPSLEVANDEVFKAKLNATQRRLIFAVHRANTFDTLTVEEIAERAAGAELDLRIVEGRLSLPMGRSLTHILRFLDNGVYKSPINNETYISNSHKKMR
jgi:hypothetical protein